MSNCNFIILPRKLLNILLIQRYVYLLLLLDCLRLVVVVVVTITKIIRSLEALRFQFQSDRYYIIHRYRSSFFRCWHRGLPGVAPAV